MMRGKKGGDMGLIGIFLKNLFRFDWMIFALAGANVYVFLRTRRMMKKLSRILRPKGSLIGGWTSEAEVKAVFAKYLKPSGEDELIRFRQKIRTSYAFYENITAIFPLMGILGTVVSLLPMVQAMQVSESAPLFFSALTSTFWGIVFAILYKTLDSYLAPEIEEAEKNLSLFLDRNTVWMKEALQKAIEEEEASEKAGEKLREGMEENVQSLPEPRNSREEAEG